VKLVTKKIKSQIDSDYPIGILLSGGLDSSFVAAIACKLLKEQHRKLIAFSNVLPEDYKGEDKDERFYIEKLEEHYDNLEVHYVSVPEDTGPYSNLDMNFERVESPVNAFHYVDSTLYEHAEKLNVRTLLTGFGGDDTISNYGNGVIFQYMRELKLLRAFKLFAKRKNETKRTLYNHFKHEVLAHIPILRTLKTHFKKNDNYVHYALQKNYLNRIISANNSQDTTYNKSYAGIINRGEFSSVLLKVRKLSISFKIEFLSPLLSKEISELYMDVPGEELVINGMNRSLIKGAMTDLVPQEIIHRTDKMPFSPDYNKRISKLNPESLAHILKNKGLIENITGIDVEILLKSIAQISPSNIKSEVLINKKVFYIPIIIIAAEFYTWISKKS
jgi:asparagine synthase (glutamine-hydrolysing)